VDKKAQHFFVEEEGVLLVCVVGVIVININIFVIVFLTDA